MKAPQRSRSLQIYVKPGIREDDILIDIWDACARFDRPQDVFRTMLRRGMIAMVESGDMPKAVIDECGLDAIVDSILERRSRKTGRTRRDTEQAPAYPPQTFAPPPVYAPYPVQPQYPPYPPQGYDPRPDGQWNGSQDARPARPPEYERSLEQPRSPPKPQRQAEADRQAIEDKIPPEPPRAAESPAPEKRQDPAPRPPAAPTAKKRLGEIM
ncbi:hypothetical protein HFN89_00590 [Rhizobium laguerreae]|nr:hypothetical protein [Rhizobium laguerreae]